MVSLQRGQSCGLESEDRDGEGLAEGHLVPGPCELVAGTREGRSGNGCVCEEFVCEKEGRGGRCELVNTVLQPGNTGVEG